MRELVRRAVVAALARDRTAPVHLTASLLADSLAELCGVRSALTRALLGG